MTPLAWYLSITIAIPLANGAAGRESSLLEHTVFVVGIPLVLIAVARVLTLHRFHDFFMGRLSSR
jgi:hypothetical protein